VTNTKLWVYLSLATMCFALAVNTAASQTLTWSRGARYDTGQDSWVAAHPSGLILEGHRTEFGNQLWYHIGKLNGKGVTWGGSQRLAGGSGVQNWPNLAISKEGYVIFVYSVGSSKSAARLWYAIGKINPNGDTDQSITWLTNTAGTFIDSGFHSSIAINENGVILLTFESGSGGNGLYYRVGHLSNPAGGDYTIQWDSGQFGVHYDDGINPHIALNNLNEVVEVHQVSSTEGLLHYRRGNVFLGTINFGGSQRYDKAGQPAVALLDSGLVVELHRVSSNDGLDARTGTLSPSNPEGIDWSDSVKIDKSGSVSYPAVASNGRYAIGTWDLIVLGDQVLDYSVATIP
jgi:hypothetical protein